MSETVLTASVTLLICLINNYFQQRKTKIKHDETVALIEYKLDELSKRVDKHNNVIERTYALEKEAVLTGERLKVINSRITELERKDV